MTADVDVFDGYAYAHTPGKAWPWHLRKRTDSKGPGTAICGAVVEAFRPEPVRREFLSETCRSCALGLARIFGGPKVDQVEKRRSGPRAPHKWEALLDQHLQALGLPKPTAEHRFFAPRRQWRFDRAWLDVKVAIEIEGGVFAGGRHSRGRGLEDDAVKYNVAALMGWLVIRATERHVRQGLAAKWAVAAVRVRSAGLIPEGRMTDISDDLMPRQFVAATEQARRNARRKGGR